MDDETKGVCSVFAALILAGILPFLAKFGLQTIPPLLFSTMTATIAGLFTLLLVFITGNQKDFFTSDKRLIGQYIWIGLMGSGLALLIFYYGLSLTTVINGSLLLQIEVVYSLILASFILKERITIQQVFWSLIIIVSVIWIISGGQLITQLNIGDLFILMVPFFWQLAHLVAKIVMKNINPITVVAARNIFGGIFLLCIQLLFAPNQLIEAMNPLTMVLFIAQGLVLALGHLTWYLGVQKINLSKATAIIIPYPLVAIALSIVFLGEQLTYIHIIGGAIIFIAIIALTRIESLQKVSG